MIGDGAALDQIYLQYAAQGQTFFQAGGDMGSFYPGIPQWADAPNITLVGGTTLTMTTNGGAYESETVWNWGHAVATGGGISLNYPLPDWQQGLDMSANQGSTTMRNVPDVAMDSDPNTGAIVYVGGSTEQIGGTSLGSPLALGVWARFQSAWKNDLGFETGM